MINDTCGSFFKVGFGRTDAERLVEELMAMYGQSYRAYHTMEHILGCLYSLTSYSEYADRPEEVEMAIWFHDAVYNTNRQDNEIYSAILWEEESGKARIEMPIRERVSKMIRATAGHDAVDDRDTALMLDIDLSILGSQPKEFERYDEQIRKEYWWVPENEYFFLRARVLRSFLDKEAIYLTEPYKKRENQARENLERKAKELESAISS